MTQDTLITAPQHLGALLRLRRKAMKLTQEDLAGLSGLSHKFIIDVERGKPTTELQKVMQLAAALGVDLVARPR